MSIQELGQGRAKESLRSDRLADARVLGSDKLVTL
jgi:hypothetical protein